LPLGATPVTRKRRSPRLRKRVYSVPFTVGPLRAAALSPRLSGEANCRLVTRERESAKL
jgi:hypothetical protein